MLCCFFLLLAANMVFQGILIHAHLPDGSVYNLYAKPKDPISQLRSTLEVVCPKFKFSDPIFFGDKDLKNNFKTLKKYGLKNDSHIYVGEPGPEVRPLNNHCKNSLFFSGWKA